MELLEKIRDMKKQGVFNRTDWELIADEMEDILSPATMWDIVRLDFSIDELIENLEFIAREADI